MNGMLNPYKTTCKERQKKKNIFIAILQGVDRIRSNSELELTVAGQRKLVSPYGVLRTPPSFLSPLPLPARPPFYFLTSAYMLARRYPCGTRPTFARGSITPGIGGPYGPCASRGGRYC